MLISEAIALAQKTGRATARKIWGDQKYIMKGIFNNILFLRFNEELKLKDRLKPFAYIEDLIADDWILIDNRFEGVAETDYP